MKGWHLIEPFKIEEKEIEDNLQNINGNDFIKVRITKSLITQSDVLCYNGEIKTKSIVLGSFGIGVVSEINNNLLGIEKGTRVYVQSTNECGACFNCQNDKPKLCENLQIAGENTNGFLCDFVSLPSNKVFPIPQSISENDSLYIGYVSLAISIIDKLDIQKGEYVAILGANSLGNILAQLLIYYQAVPILISNNNEDYEIAKNSGIYYCLNGQNNWEKEVAEITSTHMAEKVVYISGNDIQISNALSLAPTNGYIAIVGDGYKNNISLGQALKKQLNIYCIKTCYNNISSSINLIANKAVNFSNLKSENCDYCDVPKTFEKLNDEMQHNQKVYDTIVKML